MKKIISVLCVLLLSFSLVAAVEPAALFSLALPAAIAVDTGLGTFGGDDISSDAKMLIALPAEVIDSGISLVDLLSGNVLKMAKPCFDAAILAASFEDFSPISFSGSLALSQSIDLENGKFGITTDYDNVKFIYSLGSKAEMAALDGDVTTSFYIFSDSLLSLIVDVGTLSISGDTSFSGHSAELKIDLKEDVLEEYLRSHDLTLSEVRLAIARMLVDLIPDPDAIGVVSASDIVELATLGNALDILDAIAYLVAVDHFGDLQIPEAILLVAEPTIFIDGKLVEGVNLSRSLKWLMGLLNLASAF